jgi:hypothetical protein
MLNDIHRSRLYIYLMSCASISAVNDIMRGIRMAIGTMLVACGGVCEGYGSNVSITAVAASEAPRRATTP